MAQYLSAALAFARKIFAVERLPDAGPQDARRSERPSVLRLLFAAEPLPSDPPLPQRARRGVSALLFAHEPLPQNPPGPSRRRFPWLKWLLAPERIDPK